MTKIETARLAAAIAVLRPDWPEPSLRTFIDRELTHRPLHDTAVALAWVATDPDSRTPARVLEAGPWWAASRTTLDRPTPNPCPTHGNQPRRPDGECAGCFADRMALPDPMTTEEATR